MTERLASSQAMRDWCKVINWSFIGEVRVCDGKARAPVPGIVSADDIERLTALDSRWAEEHEIQKWLERASRDQTAEDIEEAVAQAVAKVRDATRRGTEQPLLSDA